MIAFGGCAQGVRGGAMTSLRTCDGAGPSSRGTTGPEGTEGGAFDASKAVKERED